MIRFDEARVVITGASGGVGSALTKGFAAAGAQVIACDMAGTDLSAPHIAERHFFDLRDKATMTENAMEILTNGAPHVVVSNAGWTRQETLAMTTAAGIDDEMDCNFNGVALLTHALLPAMRTATGNRAFVFISSCNATSHFGNPVYSAAKAATMAWMRALAVEEAPNGIRSNAVAPASIRTGAWEHRLAANPTVLDKLQSIYPLGRIVTPEEVTNAVLFLASELASGITGTTLAVDAGLSAGNLPFLDAIR
ncbi:MAG: SDR family oxidoreductase [Sedimentitalea sp.]|uniref:SDR family NAD(P)-dependent oxidoreductase n=1 Tax=Sedimentitalea sp. TaxID=2048915 RepID=UPI0032666E6C